MNIEPLVEKRIEVYQTGVENGVWTTTPLDPIKLHCTPSKEALDRIIPWVRGRSTMREDNCCYLFRTKDDFVCEIWHDAVEIFTVEQFEEEF